ncbi:MAG: Hfq-like protein [Thermoanaerobaculia bacterium]
MPYSNRPYEAENNSTGRRVFRSSPDFRPVPRNGNGNNNGRSNKPAPPEVTNAENFYYLKQMSSKAPMVIIMTDGEEIRGCIEWYDKNALKVNRDGAPNLLIQKHCIKYLFKAEELRD